MIVLMISQIYFHSVSDILFTSFVILFTEGVTCKVCIYIYVCVGVGVRVGACVCMDNLFVFDSLPTV